jgi:hypothetical protein
MVRLNQRQSFTPSPNLGRRHLGAHDFSRREDYGPVDLVPVVLEEARWGLREVGGGAERPSPTPFPAPNTGNLDDNVLHGLGVLQVQQLGQVLQWQFLVRHLAAVRNLVAGGGWGGGWGNVEKKYRCSYRMVAPRMLRKNL